MFFKKKKNETDIIMRQAISFESENRYEKKKGQVELFLRILSINSYIDIYLFIHVIILILPYKLFIKKLIIWCTTGIA